MDIEKILSETDLAAKAPVSEPERQYYYIGKARELVRRRAEEAGHPLRFCVTTFGCPKNDV